MTPYDKVYKRFKTKIEDTNLPLMSDEDQEDMLWGWLDSALSYMELDKSKIESDLTARDDDLKMFTADLKFTEIEVIALYMVVAWYEPIVNSTGHTVMISGSKDEKWANPKEHAALVSANQERYRKRARKYCRDYGYKTNSYTTTE